MVTLQESAFEGCSSLKSMMIPRTVSGIGANCFKGCSSLTTLQFEHGSGLDRACLKSAGLSNGVHVSFEVEPGSVIEFICDGNDFLDINTGMDLMGASDFKMFKKSDEKPIGKHSKRDTSSKEEDLACCKENLPCNVMSLKHHGSNKVAGFFSTFGD